jgi:hypothetical protein
MAEPERVVVDTAAVAVAVGVKANTITKWVQLGYLTPVEPARRGVISRFYLDDVYACHAGRRPGRPPGRLTYSAPGQPGEV